MGHLDPCEVIPYQVPHSHISACGVTVESSDNISAYAKLKSLVTLVNSLFPQESKENESQKYFVYKYPTLFALKGEPLTIIPYYCHTIKQNTGQPIYSKPYLIPLKFHQQIEEQLQELYKQGLIRPSCSAYNSPCPSN